MSSGRLRNLAHALTAALLLNLLGACGTPGASDTRTVDRRASIQRWNDCMEREGSAAGLSAAGPRGEAACEGHRRDVLRAFPPHMAPRLREMMEERDRSRMRARLGARANATSLDPVLQGLVERF